MNDSEQAERPKRANTPHMAFGATAGPVGVGTTTMPPPKDLHRLLWR